MSKEMIGNGRTIVRTSILIALSAKETFDVLIEELSMALLQGGMSLEAGPDGRVLQGEFEVGRVIAWEAGKCVLLQWRQAEWNVEELTEVEMRFEPTDGGTQVTLEHREWGGLIGDPGELAGWFAGEVAAPLLQATAPASLGDWLTDRQARRPSGAQARAGYRDPLYHYPNFKVLLAELALTPNDFLIEVGCGGGAFLKEMLKSGCRAAAVDHSYDMVRVARELNHDAIAEGRLEVQQASADRLPFPNATFTCATMTGVFGFLPNPLAALRELRRVLRNGGRLVMMGSDPALRGTLAAPEPMASRLRFYDDDEFKRLALEAGFDGVSVMRRDLEPFAREVGIPQEHIPLFKGPGGPVLLARNG